MFPKNNLDIILENYNSESDDTYCPSDSESSNSEDSDNSTYLDNLEESSEGSYFDY